MVHISHRVLNLHGHTRVKFSDNEGAIMFHDAIRDSPIKFVRRDGPEGAVESFRPLPPHIQRRGAALHPVYGGLRNHALTAAETIKQVHRSHAPPSRTPSLLWDAL